MSISSMTGFARSEGATDAGTWVWEIKSVNAKGLDVRLRLPRSLDFLETPVRAATTQRFRRGNITLGLEITWTRPAGGLRVNRENLGVVLAAVAALQQQIPNLSSPAADGVLALRGVLEQVEDEALAGEARDQLATELMAGLAAALEQLAASRAGEGARLEAVLRDQLAMIETLTGDAATLAATRPEAIRARLKEQVEALMADVAGLDETRLTQEAALLMTRADVREELDRLAAHVGAARELLATEGAVGRRLDFLCQEFNRESNTLCAKSSEVALTRIGLELKAVIEQFREQVQNIE